MVTVDEKKSGDGMGELCAAWKRANDAKLWPYQRASALDIAERLFDGFGVHLQPEMTRKCGITREKIDRLKKYIKGEGNLNVKRFLFVVAMIVIVAILIATFPG